jgi:hypothetical protein
MDIRNWRTNCRCQCTVKKVSGYPVPTRDVTARESLVSAIPAGDGKTAHLFLQCGTGELFIASVNVKSLKIVNIFRDF